jgi:hypothetical protein
MMKEREDGKKKKYQYIKLLRRLKAKGWRRKQMIEKENENSKKLEED